MSPEPSLPPELASFESQLFKQPLPGSGIDRDELLYQAGWAAAQASRKRNWLWPTTSGVLAASVLVLALFLIRSPEESHTVTLVEAASPKAQVAVAEPDLQIPVVSPPEQFSSRWARRSPFLSPFLAMRERALRMEFEEPVSYSEYDEEDVPKAVTARELMQEILGEIS